MAAHKKPHAAGKAVAKKESGHKANTEGKKIPKVGAGPDEKVAKMHKKQLHAPAKEGSKKMDIPYGKHPVNTPAGPMKKKHKKA
jgi:hypothetical protein